MCNLAMSICNMDKQSNTAPADLSYAGAVLNDKMLFWILFTFVLRQP